MLKKIPSIISPQLLKVLCEMGHGDEIIIADGNFPSESVGKDAVVVRLDGHNVPEILSAMVEFFPLDQVTAQPVGVMATADGSKPPVWSEFETVLKNEPTENYDRGFEEIERYEFYTRAKKAYAVVATSEKALYANIILKKGTC